MERQLSIEARFGFCASLLAFVASCAPSVPSDVETRQSALNSNVVVTVRDGAGVLQPNVSVMAKKNSGTVQATATTNASGQATLSLPASSYRFAVEETDSAFYSGAVGHCVTPSCTTASITITRVDVTVVNTSGTPQQGLTVLWEKSGGGAGGYVQTGANGHALIAVSAASYRFVLEMNGQEFASGAAGHCTVPTCTAATITVTAPITVTVRDVNNVPKPNVSVGWEGASSNGGWRDTDANGVVTLSAPPGAYLFVTYVGNTEFLSGAPGHCVVPGCTSATITIGAPLVVTVVDTAGTPLSGKTVLWQKESWDTGGDATTNASGQATVIPPTEPVRFKVVLDGTEFYSTETFSCAQPSCTSATITVSTPTVVTVVDGTGAPVSGKAVTPLADEAGISAGNKTTNASGQATFRLPFAHWRFRATCAANSEQFFSGNAGHCLVSGCTTAKITMPCGQCTGQTNGTTCNDQNPCTGSSTCQNQKCTGANPMNCAAGDACHEAGACSAETGACSGAPKANGTSCNDNDACTSTSSCQAGVCTGGSPVTCTASDQCHTAGTCNPATGACSNPTVANGTSCNDGSSCTQTDTCQSGTCTGGNPVTCTASDQCHTAGTCNPATGACSNPAVANGTACNDGSSCTQTDTCQSGACAGGNPVTCMAQDQCHTAGTCNPATGACSNPLAANGTSCSDGTSCTQTDTCQSGTCTGGNPVTCTAQDQCHTVGTCSPSTGVCSNPLAAAGTSCGAGGTCNSEGTCVASNNDAPIVNAGPDQSADLTQPKPSPNFTLQRISTAFNNPVGIEYHPILNKMVMSVNCCSGQPGNFESVNADGTRQAFTNISGLGDEVYFAIARDEGGGHSRGGFIAGEMMTGTGVPGQIARISPDGSTIVSPWVQLPGESGLLRGQLQLDRTGLYGGDLLVTTTAGHLWRVTSAGNTTLIATLVGDNLEGLTVIPNEPTRYGPWAGKILVGDEDIDAVYAVDATGQVTTYQLGVRPENIMVVPQGENFYGVDYYGTALWGASASQFTNMVGDILIVEEYGGKMWHVHWNSVTFQKTLLAQVNLWEHTAFGPAPMVEVGQSNVQVALSGSATDDGRPAGSQLSQTWSVASGPGPVTFADSQAASTTATFSEAGTYVLTLTATDGTLSTSDQVTVTIRRISPHNDAPVANAGPDQTVTIPQAVALTGSATDDGVPIGSAISLSWSQVSGPVPALLANSKAGITPVIFVAAGTYVFQLDASDSELTGSDQVTITVNPEPAIAGGTLQVSLSDAGPMPLGAAEFVTATLVDASATPVPNFPIRFTVTGANPGTNTVVTDATGVAIFPYTARYPGTDSIFATATGVSHSLDSNTVSVTWLDIPLGAPLLTQGWIKSPIHQSTIRDRVPVKLSDQVTLASGTLRYWPYAHPDQVGTLASGLSGGPGATLATFDTTILANGSYIIDLSGTDDTGRQRQSEVLVIVDGEYKPGRVVVELVDFTLPLAGLPITIGRRYDSLEKDQVGDFGYGWSLLVGHPKLEKDIANNVTITMPNGRRSTFYFTGQNPVINGGPVGIVLGFLMLTGYTPAPGIFGTLTSDGCPVMTLHPYNGGPPSCFPALSPSELVYAPTQYTYTDPYGTAYVMGATGELRSITDRQGNSLTFQPNGIFSSTGKNVTFVRDAQGRITHVDYPPYFGTEDDAARYQYDAAGDLVTVDLAKVPFVFFRTMHHTYQQHRLETSKDARGNTVRTSTYFADGRLETDKDALQNVTRYAYNLATRTTTTTYEADNGVVTETFDPRGLLLSRTDQLGHTTTHEYDDAHNEVKRTNALGEETTIVYDRGNATSVTTPKGTTHTTYSADNLPITFTDRLGHTTTVEYDSELRVPTRIADELGTRFRFTNSPNGQPLTVTDADGHVAYLQYDIAGNLSSRRDWLGRVTSATYDEAGHRLTETAAKGGVTTNTYLLPGWLNNKRDANNYLVQYSYDPNGNVTSDNDSPFARGQTVYTYDALNHLTQIWRVHDVQENPNGTTVLYERDFRGNAVTMTDENAHSTTYEYDQVGNLITTTFFDGTSTIRGYDALNRLASITDERGHTTTYEYDPGCDCSDQITRVTDPLSRATVTTYDENGRRSSVTDANGHTTSFAYNVRGQVIETHYHDGTSTHEGYDSLGRRTSMTDQTSAPTLYGYDVQGQLTSVTDPLSNVTRYSYDLDGNLSSVTDANSHTTAYEYDLLGRKTKRTLPLNQVETFTYDLAGRLTAHADFRAKTTTMTYDTRDRMLTRDPDASLTEPSHSYAYWPTGTRKSSTDASGVTSYTYDVRERLKTKTSDAGTLTYTYDLAGNVSEIRSSNANGTWVNYGWDAANQLVTVTDNRVGGTTTAAYTATRRPSVLGQPNGVGATYAYDPLDRVTSLAWRRGTDLAFASWGYTHNPRGQRLTSTDITGRNATYSYDDGSRLVTETIAGDPGGAAFNGVLSYVLDGGGNRLSRTSTLAAISSATYAYDANDQLTTDTYDANGNTTSSAGHTFAYDFEGRLVSKDGTGVTVVYDCDGNRVAKTVGGVTTRYLVDDLNPTGYLQVLEELSGNVVQTRYTYGSKVLSQTRNVGTTPMTSYYGFDAHGNITFLTDATGAATDSYDYDAWGNVIASTGGTPNTRLYTGEEFDADLGLINLRARQYRPATGRFLTIDPMNGDQRKPLSFNRYTYTSVNPVNAHDPTGAIEAIELTVFAIMLHAVPYQIKVGTDGGYTYINTTLLIGIGTQVGCVFWNIASAFDLEMRLGKKVPPWPWNHCGRVVDVK